MNICSLNQSVLIIVQRKLIMIQNDCFNYKIITWLGNFAKYDAVYVMWWQLHYLVDQLELQQLYHIMELIIEIEIT